MDDSMQVKFYGGPYDGLKCLWMDGSPDVVQYVMKAGRNVPRVHQYVLRRDGVYPHITPDGCFRFDHLSASVTVPAR